MAIGSGDDMVKSCWDPNYPSYPSYPNPNIHTTWTYTKEVPVKTELYPEDLETLSVVLSYVNDILGEAGVVDVELRVKVNESKFWAVLGYGEAGDPCILRFEKD